MNAKTPFPFLEGGGEMGELARRFDWSTTPLGTPEQWPQSLRTTVSLILNSSFPMFVWWGGELITIYNDAYRSIAGNKHPALLGTSGKEAWSEIWTDLAPLVSKVFGGGSTWSEDLPLRMIRHGFEEDTFFTFSYSPVLNEAGVVGGLFCACIETTEKVNSKKKLEESEQSLRNLILKAPVAMCIFRGPDYRVEIVNKLMLESWGKREAEVIGKPVYDALPEARGQGYEDLLYRVYTTGETITAFDAPGTLTRNGVTETRYVNLVYDALREADGSISGIMVVNIDVTEQVKARRKIEESEARFQTLIRDSAVGMIVLLGEEMQVEIVNDAYCKLIGHTVQDTLGKPLFDVIPHAAEAFYPLLKGVLHTGEPFAMDGAPYSVKSANGQTINGFVNFVYQPYREADGTITGVMAIVQDVTQQAEAQHRVEETVNQMQAMVESAPFPIGVYIGRELRIRFANPAILDVWGKGKDVLGKLYREVLPELEGQQIFEQLDKVYTTGIPFHAKNQRVDLIIDGKLTPYFFNYSFTPLFDTEGRVYGVMNTAADVTELNLAHLKVEESEKSLRNTILQAPVAMCIFKGPEHVVEIANDRMFQFWGKTQEAMLGKPIFEGLPEARGQGFEELLKSVFTIGETVRAHGVPVTLPRDGNIEEVFVDFVYEAYREADGTISGVMAVAHEVTEQVIARQKIEESEARFRVMADSMPQLTWTADKEGELDYFNQAVYDYSGLDYNQLKKEGWLQIVHPDEQEENLRHWEEAVQTGKDFIFQHRFRNRDGVYRWHLSRALPYRDSEGNITMWIGTSTDIHEQKIFEEELDKKVKERTTALEDKNRELERSNSYLEEFAHAASHDLKEPIRKIHFFSDRLKSQLSGKLAPSDEHMFNRMEHATQRMNSLIDDLLLYSHVSQRPHEKDSVDLAEKVKKVMEDLELDIQEKKAIITTSKLPVVQGYRRQLQQLFQNLISNALKYSHADRPPEITITADVVPGAEAGLSLDKHYHHITVRDNGIGFEQQQAEKIFQMFQRLHGKTEYEGTGVGLSIVRKVAENHEGKIIARGEPGQGAAFHVYLPVD